MGSPRSHLKGKGSATERRWKGKTRSQQIERRASWVIELWESEPSLGYADTKARVMAVFECGHTAAEDAIKRANERLEEAQDDAGVKARVGRQLLLIAEQARREGKPGTAVRALDVYLVRFGHAAPLKPEEPAAGGDDDELEELRDLTDADLEVLVKLGGRKKTT